MIPIDPRAPYLVTWAPSTDLPNGSQIVLFGRRLLRYPAGADSIVLLTPAPGTPLLPPPAPLHHVWDGQGRRGRVRVPLPL